MPSTEVSSHSSSVVVTIDGPAGAGKSTVAKELARRLGFFYLDTGAMYRALTLKALRKNVPLTDENALVRLAKDTVIDFQETNQNTLSIFLDGENVSETIRTLEVTQSTFHIAAAPRVREEMVKRQREIGKTKNIVVEGRDTGTVVFPEAKRKFYLDANPEERAKRRILELKAKGLSIDEPTLKKDLFERDQKDLTRQVSPLKKADDAVVIDSTNLSVGQVVDKMLEYIK